ncbi:MAG: ASKHA domain-containing protein [Acidimicrobiales bacterium]
MIFTPSGLRIDVEPGASLLDAARAAGADLDSVCGGRGLCGRCQINPSVGEFAKWAMTSRCDALSAATTTEAAYDGRRSLDPGNRLACQARVLADVVVDIPAASQVHRPVVRKQIDLGEVSVDPLVTLHYVEVPDSDLGDEHTDYGLLRHELAREWGLGTLSIDLAVLADLQPALAARDRAVTAVVHDRDRLIAMRAGYADTVLGVAIDVGSTTIAGYLVDLATGEVAATTGRMNPQIRFGEDLMSRVSYVMMNPGGDHELTRAVRAALDDLIGELCDRVGVDRREIHDVVIVGNPIMHHLVLGIDPTPLGAAPFTLAVGGAVHGRATDLDLDLPRAMLYVGPCIAGHVGADAAALTLAEGPHRLADPVLLVDVGTNAEIILGNRDRLLAASSPTGPAFEGAQISCGQRATAGAIERVRIDRSSLEPRFRVIGSDLWSDHPDFADSSAHLDITGVCGSGIIEVIGEMFLAGIIDANGVIDGSLADRTPRVVADGRTFSYELLSGLAITQNDVRAIQLAKAALRAGIDLLMEHAGLGEVHDIRLAGAFGTHIDPVYALILGLVPDCPVQGVRAVGNASGVGAARMLLSRSQRTEIEATVAAITKIETATEPRFQELFVAAMAFPHDTATSPHLAAAVELPPRGAAPATARGRRRARSAGESRDR